MVMHWTLTIFVLLLLCCYFYTFSLSADCSLNYFPPKVSKELLKSFKRVLPTVHAHTMFLRQYTPFIPYHIQLNLTKLFKNNIVALFVFKIFTLLWLQNQCQKNLLNI